MIGSGINSTEWFINVTGDKYSTYSAESLNPYTNYTFRIRARTNAGWGNFSKNVTALTHEGRKCIHILRNIILRNVDVDREIFYCYLVYPMQ